jgi:excisionase family DNA binding protein
VTTPAKPRLRLLSVDDIADDLGVSTKTIRRLIDGGELRAHRIGRALRVSEDEVRQYLNRRRA